MRTLVPAGLVALVTAAAGLARVASPATADTAQQRPGPRQHPRPAVMLPAFPGAQGAGALSAGGRGGAVYEVETLEDSGPGSLRACVEARGPRTCVFRVGGVIHLRRALVVSQPYLTVAGQTAPGDGVALELGTPGMSRSMLGFTIDTHDVVIRYLRVWGNWVANQDPDTNPGTACFVMSNVDSRNIIVDHVTCLWASAISYSSWHAPGAITFQWSLWGENLLNPGSGHGKQAVSILFAPGLTGDYQPDAGGDLDLHHNVIATATHRNPALCGIGMRFVNNIVHNWSRASYVDSGDRRNAHGASVADFIGNRYSPGNFPRLTTKGVGYAEIMANRGVARLYLAGNRSEWSGPPDGRGRGPVSAKDDQWKLTSGNVGTYQGPDQAELTPLPARYRRSTPLCAVGETSGCTRAGTPGPPITVDPVSRLDELLLSDGGVGMSRRLACDGSWHDVSDSARDRILAYVAARAGPSSPPRSAVAANGGALPVLARGTPCTDSDHDGMPDAWEDAHGLDKHDPADAQLVQRDGYTNLEHYLDGR